jgi:hypothetical protein
MYIGFNIRQIQDIIDYADKFNVEGEGEEIQPLFRIHHLILL